jgi:transposase
MDGMTIMRVYNWKKHDKIKENEVDFLLKKAIQIIDDSQEPWTEKNFGRPPYPPKSMLSICLLKVYFGMPYRDLESLIRSNRTLQELLKLKEVPDHNTIQRSMEKIPMRYLQQLNQQLAISFKKNGKTLPSMLLDSASGNSTSRGNMPKELSGRKST